MKEPKKEEMELAEKSLKYRTVSVTAAVIRKEATETTFLISFAHNCSLKLYAH